MKKPKSEQPKIVHNCRKEVSAKVSIIIPTYNEENNIERLLNNLLKLSYKNTEIIVADDGSTDRTKEILKKYKSVKKFFFPHRGRGFILNSAIKKSTGDYIWRIDADCVVKEDPIDLMLKKFDTDVVLVSGGIMVENKNKFFPALIHCVKLMNKNYLYGGGNSMFKAKYLKHNLFSEAKDFSGEDTEMSERIRKQKFKQEFEPKAKIYTKEPENFKTVIKQRFRHARSYIRFLRRSKSKKLFPVIRDSAATIMLLLSLVLSIYSTIFLYTSFIIIILLLLFFSYQGVKVYKYTRRFSFAFFSVFVRIFFVFVRTAGYLREIM